MNEYPLTSIVTLALVSLWWVLGSRVSLARAIYADQQQNPAMFHSLEIYSDVGFMIAFRNHQNLSEHLVIMLPTLWICAVGVSDLVASILGSFYFVGRVWYARNYPRDFSHRPAVFLSLWSFRVLFVGAVGGVIYALLRHVQ
jgi:glutathione S-transferase